MSIAMHHLFIKFIGPVIVTDLGNDVEWARPWHGAQRSFICSNRRIPVAIYDLSMYPFLDCALDINTGMSQGHTIAAQINTEIQAIRRRALLALVE